MYRVTNKRRRKLRPSNSKEQDTVNVNYQDTTACVITEQEAENSNWGQLNNTNIAIGCNINIRAMRNACISRELGWDV